MGSIRGGNYTVYMEAILDNFRDPQAITVLNSLKTSTSCDRSHGNRISCQWFPYLPTVAMVTYGDQVSEVGLIKYIQVRTAPPMTE